MRQKERNGDVALVDRSGKRVGLRRRRMGVCGIREVPARRYMRYDGAGCER